MHASKLFVGLIAFFISFSAYADEFSELNSNWIRHVKEVVSSDFGRKVVLQDSTSWYTSELGYSKCKYWEQDDPVVIVYELDLGLKQIYNLDKENSIWSSSNPTLWTPPQAPELVKIKSIEDNNSTVVLSDGTRVHSPYVEFKDWKVGESVIPLLVNQKGIKYYGLRRGEYKTMIWKLEVQ